MHTGRISPIDTVIIIELLSRMRLVNPVRLSRLTRLNETKLLYYSKTVNGGFTTLAARIIDLSNFCHFLRNKDSKYCFFSCNRCSLRLKSGHLFTLRATFIFLHRASKALSRAANSFMLVSWSRLLRNIH